jgi:glutathione S-transferase
VRQPGRGGEGPGLGAPVSRRQTGGSGGITIFGVCRSRAARNVWLLEETGCPWRLEPVVQANRLPDPAAPGAPLNALSPDSLALSPQGAVPVMQDGDLVLAENLAIDLHIARAHGGDPGPRDAREDALMQQWALYGATERDGVLRAPWMAFAGKTGRDAAAGMGDAVTAMGLVRPSGARPAVSPAMLTTSGHGSG